MVKTRGLQSKKLKNALQRRNGVKVVLTRLNFESEIFRKALFKFHGIRDFRVVLQRLPNEIVAPKPAKNLLVHTREVKSIRAQVPWLPTIASSMKHSSPAAGPSQRRNNDVGCSSEGQLTKLSQKNLVKSHRI